MTSEEFEKQRGDASKRFYIDHLGDGAVQYQLIDRIDGRVLGYDGGEPEDQLLVRDWNWVAVELNALDKKIKSMAAVVEAAGILTAAIEDLAGKGCMTATTSAGATATGESGGFATTTIRTIIDDRLFVEILRNANLVKTKIESLGGSQENPASPTSISTAPVPKWAQDKIDGALKKSKEAKTFHPFDLL